MAHKGYVEFLRQGKFMKQIEIYQSDDGQTQLNVSLQEDTVWLSQAQMAELFGIKRPAITKHLGNIFKSG